MGQDHVRDETEYVDPVWVSPSTKLFMPAVPSQYLARPRLERLIDRVMSHRVALISAPAGYGKSTFLSACLRDGFAPVAWVSLDHRDNDFGRFWTNVVTALRKIRPDMGLHALRLLQSGGQTELGLTRLVNDIAQSTCNPVIVLDDYHEIEIDAIHESVAFFIEYLPAEAHLIISSRTDPPLPLVHLRGRGLLFDIGARDLQFTPDESDAYLNEAMELSLAREQANLIHTRTEGWIVGLQMVAVSLQAAGTGFLAALEGATKPTMQYLAEEVLEKQEAGIRQFLLDTCILDSLNAALCNAVTGREDSPHTLQELCAKRLFLQALDHEGEWFRYHHLFRDLLYDRLQVSDPERLRTLHRRASEWYEAKGRIEEAIEHALSADDFDRAGLLVRRLAFVVCGQDKPTMTLNWVARLPQQLVARDLAISILGASACEILREPDKAAEYVEGLADVDASLAGDAALFGSDSATAMGLIAGIRALDRFRHGDVIQAKAMCLAQLEKLPPEEERALCVLNYALGMVSWGNGELESARCHYEESWRLSQLVGYSYFTLQSLSNVAGIRFAQGHLHSAAEVCREAIQLGTADDGVESALLCYAHLLLGSICYQWNDLDQSRFCVERAIALSEILPEPVIRLNGSMCLARIDLAQGSVDSAIETGRRAVLSQSKMVAAPLTGSRHQADVFMTRLWLRAGNVVTALDSAQRWSESLEDLSEEIDADGALPDGARNDLYWNDTRDIWTEKQLLTHVRLKIAHGEHAGLLELLDAIARDVDWKGWRSISIEVRILRALVLHANRKTASALREIATIFLMTEGENWLRVFLDEGRPMCDLLQRAELAKIAPGPVSRLLKAFGTEAAVRGGSQAGTAPAVAAGSPGWLPEPLTPREMRILELIGVGMSNREIADTLAFALPTIKNHVQDIFTKLGVSSRAGAVSLAKDLGLL